MNNMTIMKKSLSLLCSLCISIFLFADGLTATLQQGDQMTPFYGVDAFKEAYQAADSGAVITLSVGSFNPVDSIQKSLTIVGSCGLSTIEYENTNCSTAIIVADNVKIEGVKYTDLYLGDIKNCYIKRSWIINLRTCAISNHFNTMIDQSYVVNDYAISKSINYNMRNSLVDFFRTHNSPTNIAYFTNCYFSRFTYDVVEVFQPYAIYKNNVLICGAQINTSVSSPSEYYNNLICKGFSRYSILMGIGVVNVNNLQVLSLSVNRKVGIIPADTTWGYGGDGTYIGPAGGAGVSMYPAIPRVVNKIIAPFTDSDNKLNIEIIVKAEK
jgi:hypothetical protein